MQSFLLKGSVTLNDRLSGCRDGNYNSYPLESAHEHSSYPITHNAMIELDWRWQFSPRAPRQSTRLLPGP